MKAATAFGVGAIFAVGLVVSGMTEPAKILAFLDVTGAWDITLMFVMGAAIAVHLPVVRMMRGRTPVLADRVHAPSDSKIDVKLVGGAALFGVGWGLSGYCPGPALVSIVAGGLPVLAFVGMLLVGLAIAKLATRG